MKTTHYSLISIVACTLFIACNQRASGSVPAPSASAQVVPLQLPAEYAAVRVGMPLSELTKLFPPVEPIDACAIRLVGRSTPHLEVPGQDQRARTVCLDLIGAGGPTLGELADILKLADKSAALAVIRSVAQIRAAVRAGAISEARVLDALGDERGNSIETVLSSAATLCDGAKRFLKDANGRRSMCATIADDCSGFDAERLRRFISGGYTLGQLDADAHARVVYGKCRGDFLRNERELRAAFLSEVGGTAAVGIARSARGDKGISVEDPSSYALFSAYTGATAPMAKLAVAAALAIPDTEAYWRGAVSLAADSSAATANCWGKAIVWPAQGRVARVMVPILDATKAKEAVAELSKIYGLGATTGAVTTWALPSGVTARLDLGTSAALVVEDPTLTRGLALVQPKSPPPAAP
jgi:hypothetical protein